MVFRGGPGRTAGTVPIESKKEDKRKPPQDTPMPLRDKDGAIVLRTTMEVWSSTSGRDVPEGYKPHHEIVVNVQKGWTTAKWSPSTGAHKINHATVDGHKVDLDGPANTSRGADGRHVLEIDRRLLPLGEVKDRSKENHSPARQSHWKEGAAGRTGAPSDRCSRLTRRTRRG